jgi:hypothetical protein
MWPEAFFLLACVRAFSSNARNTNKEQAVP